MTNIYDRAVYRGVTVIFALVLSLASLGITVAGVPGTLRPTLEFVLVDGVYVPVQSGSPLPDFELQERPVISLAGVWKKERMKLDTDRSFTERNEITIAALEAEAAGRHLPGYNDSGWTDKYIPGVECDMPGDESNPPEPFFGGVWYRRKVYIPSDWAGRINRLKCLGANYIFDLWINGKYVGVHEGGYTPFAFDVSKFLNYGANNQIAIRIDNPSPGARQDAVPSWFLMDWWSYTGIIQDIYLDSAPAVSIVRVNVFPLDYNGRLDVQVVVENKSLEDKTVTVELQPYHADPNAAGYLTDPRPAAIVGRKAYFEGETSQMLGVSSDGMAVARFNVRVIAPMRWTPLEPNLYVLHTRLAGEGIADEHYTQFGVRTVSKTDGKLMLNGRVAFFPGVARHEEYPDTGRTASWDRIVEDIKIIKDLNALFLRTGHYPNHPYTYVATDRIGVAVMSEIPVYWFLGWNWDYQEERRIADQMFREMVLQGNNRPSVLLWGTENECPFVFANKVKEYNERIANDFHLLYDDGRLLTQSPAGNDWKPMLKTQDPLDVAGWTLYYGVFYGDENNIYGETIRFLAEHQSLYPDYPIIATEFGFWSDSDGSEEEKQVKVLEETFRAFADAASLDVSGNVNPNGIVAATTWFCVFDWFTKNGLPDFVAPFHQTMGLIHMDRTTWKPVAYALQEAYAPYAAFGGLGPEPDDYVDEEEPTGNEGDDDLDDSKGSDANGCGC